MQNPCSKKNDPQSFMVTLHINSMSLSQNEIAEGKIKCPPTLYAYHRFALFQTRKSVTKYVFQHLPLAA